MKYKRMRKVTLLLIVLMGVFIGIIIVSAEEPQDDGDEANAENVKPGIEVLLDDHLDWIEGKRVGLITNPTGVTSDLESSIDVLYNHPDVNLTALYGPEHGIRGEREAGEHVDSYIDEKTGLPVYSLYGETWKPTEEMLEDVDVLLYDIQDIDSNVYTYIYTLGFAMEAAAGQDKELIVLDRPNPNGGTKVEGPVRFEDAVSFMGRFLLPIRHGMTVGELATMWNTEYGLDTDVKVAEMEDWERTMSFEDTGLPWVMTSPNIPTEDSAHLYSGTELLDDTNLSEGLGTTRPFELVGAPWIDAEDLAEDMNNLELPGVKFRPANFTPTSGEYEGELVGGVQIHIDDPLKIDQVELGLHLIDVMRNQDPEKFEMSDNYAELIGDPEAADMLSNGEPVDDIMASWGDELNTWVKDVRNPYLLYPPYPEDTISSEDILATVTELEESGDIMDDGAAHDLKLHVKAVGQYEKKEAVDKVIKHMKGFKKLIDAQKENNLISDKAQVKLQQKADAILAQWK